MIQKSIQNSHVLRRNKRLKIRPIDFLALHLQPLQNLVNIRSEVTASCLTVILPERLILFEFSVGVYHPHTTLQLWGP